MIPVLDTALRAYLTYPRIHKMRFFETSSEFVFRTPNSSLRIDRATGAVEYPAPASSLAMHPLDAGQSIIGILGMIELPQGHYLALATKCELAGHLLQHEVYKVTTTELLAVADPRLGVPAAIQGDHYVSLVRRHLKNAWLYFSPTHDLTNSFQRLSEGNSVDSRFFWNAEFSSPFKYTEGFVIRAVYGIFSEHTSNLNGHELQLSLFSRRSVFRAGTRYFRRGLDSQGHAANFNETEQVVWVDKRRVFSYLQTRGSVPALWGEVNTLRYRPKLQIGDVSASVEAAKRHFEEQKSLYGPQFLVNLVNQSGYEKPVKEIYERVVSSLADKQLTYVYFDFHKECSKMRWHRVQLLLQELQRLGLEQVQWFEQDGEKVVREQNGIVRTNCMDCLDRTNVVQSTLALHVLELQLKSIGVLSEQASISHYAPFMKRFRAIWADNADGVSTAYSGTGALKTDFTRTGTRTKIGAFDDFCNSCLRYIGNNLRDGPRQDGFSLVLGEVNPLREYPYKDTRPLLIQSMPYVAAGTALVALLSLMYPSQTHSATFNGFMTLVFALAMIGAVRFIFAHGMQYVNWPQLTPVDFVAFNGDKYGLQREQKSSKFD